MANKVVAISRKNEESKDCYVSSCNTAEREKCEGIKGAYKCASCRKKKNFLGIEI